MKEEKKDQILKALSVPVIALAFLPLWMMVCSMNTNIVPDPRLLIGTVYATVITISFIFFGLKLWKIDE
jgi:hypothetical protein